MAAHFTTTGSDTYPAGHVLQTVTSSYTTQWTQTLDGTTHENLNNGSSDLSIAITPASTSNKVLLKLSFGRVIAHNTGSGWGLGIIIRRGNGSVTSVGINTSSGEPKCSFSLTTDSISYDGNSHTFQYLDSPSSTSAVVYKFQGVGHTQSSNYVSCWNRAATVGTNTAAGYQAVTTIQFIACEIAG